MSSLATMLPPGMLLILGGFLIAALPWGKLRSGLAILLPILGLVQLWTVFPLGTEVAIRLFDMDLMPVREGSRMLSVSPYLGYFRRQHLSCIILAMQHQ